MLGRTPRRPFSRAWLISCESSTPGMFVYSRKLRGAVCQAPCEAPWSSVVTSGRTDEHPVWEMTSWCEEMEEKAASSRTRRARWGEG